MIVSLFHKGSGLGNQLFRYIATRVLAMDKGYEFSMVAPELFKGKDFMDLDMGVPFDYAYTIDGITGASIPHSYLSQWQEWDKHCYDPDINFVEDNTIIDGNFEDERYFEHRLPEIREWLKVQPMLMGNTLCIINFRGGEYKFVPELYLPQEYWDKAIRLMLLENPNMVFEVHTDDIEEARHFFPEFPIVHDIGINWRSIRYAKYLILSNSSFGVIPALLNEDVKKIYAPKYWNRRNVGVWEYPQGYYKKFKYI